MSAVRIRKCGICKQQGHNSRTCPQKTSAAAQTAEVAAPQLQQPQQPQQLTADGKPDLGLLNIGNRQVFINLLPSQAESVIVKYQPDVQISCVIPPQKFPISYAYNRSTRNKATLDITTPTLIMSCGYGEVPNTRNYQRSLRPYTLWIIDTQRKSQIYVKPYLFANVWENGKICFGGLKPSSLRQAYNYYWTSSFNGELFREVPGITHTCNNKLHSFAYHNGHKCDPTKKKHTCDCPRVTFHKHNKSHGSRGGCGCTSVGRSKACRGACEYSSETQCDCCRAIKAVQEQAKLLDPNIGVRKLAKLSVVEGAEYPGCGCDFRHKRGCGCGKLNCSCECFCDCCKATCDHSVCECSCCKDTCNCRCRCTTDDRFKKHLQVYHEKLMGNQRWKRRNELFCGTKFWASPRGGHGTLLTNDKNLLNKVPRNFWRKDQNGQPLLIALANRKVDGNWIFESGGFVFELAAPNVVAR